MSDSAGDAFSDVVGQKRGIGQPSPLELVRDVVRELNHASRNRTPRAVAEMLLARGLHVTELLDILRGEVDADYLGDWCGWQLLASSDEGGPAFAAIRLNSGDMPPAVLLLIDNP